MYIKCTFLIQTIDYRDCIFLITNCLLFHCYCIFNVCVVEAWGGGGRCPAKMEKVLRKNVGFCPAKEKI